MGRVGRARQLCVDVVVAAVFHVVYVGFLVGIEVVGVVCVVGRSECVIHVAHVWMHVAAAVAVAVIRRVVGLVGLMLRFAAARRRVMCGRRMSLRIIAVVVVVSVLLLLLLLLWWCVMMLMVLVRMRVVWNSGRFVCVRRVYDCCVIG